MRFCPRGITFLSHCNTFCSRPTSGLIRLSQDTPRRAGDGALGLFSFDRTFLGFVVFGPCRACRAARGEGGFSMLNVTAETQHAYLPAPAGLLTAVPVSETYVLGRS